MVDDKKIRSYVLKNNTSHQIKCIYFFVLYGSVLANKPCNFLCVNEAGKVAYLCQGGEIGPLSCCQNKSKPAECPSGFPLGPYQYGSVEYINHDLRQFQDAATNNVLDHTEYENWTGSDEGKIPMEALMDDFNAVDVDGDQKISLSEFIAFRKSDASVAVVEGDIQLAYLILLGILLVVFFSIAMKVFTKKLDTL